MTVLKLSEVRSDNEKFRIDDGYFAKLPVLTQRRVEALTHVRLGTVCGVFRKGIFDIKANTYAATGVPFVRIGNLRNGLVDSEDLTFITPEANERESKTALKFGDIILSKTAYPAASFVNLPKCNVSQDTIAVRLSPGGRKQLKSGFVVAYLNSRFGLSLMGRHFQGNVQAHLSLPDGRKIPIPVFDEALQEAINRMLVHAHEQILEASRQMGRATSALNSALGLTNWRPPEPLTYSRAASEAFAAHRLDSQYFAPRVADLISHLSVGGRTVGDTAPPRHEKFTASGIGSFCYIEISDVRRDGTARCRSVPMYEAPSRATWHVRSGDVLTSTVRPNRRLSALVTAGQDECIASSGFIVLQPKAVPGEVLLTYLRLPLFCELMDLHTSASMYPAISERDLLALPFPEIGEVVSAAIVADVRSAHTARRRASDLVANAKLVVEVGIEKSENEALQFLRDLES